jgi:hypothetical protein
MSNFFAFVGATVGGWIGWAIAARFGIMTAWMVSAVGTAAGVYLGRRAADALLE